VDCVRGVLRAHRGIVLVLDSERLGRWGVGVFERCSNAPCLNSAPRLRLEGIH
jgi:hypothetical protein